MCQVAAKQNETSVGWSKIITILITKSMTTDSVLFLQFPTLQQMVNIDFNLDRICRTFNISLFISSLYIENYLDRLPTESLEFTLQSLISCLTVVFVFLFNVTVWYEPRFPSIAERMVSISVPSCRGWEHASISYHNPIVGLSRPVSLSASQSERLLPVWFCPVSASPVLPAALTCSYANFGPA